MQGPLAQHRRRALAKPGGLGRGPCVSAGPFTGAAREVVFDGQTGVLIPPGDGAAGRFLRDLGAGLQVCLCRAALSPK